MSLVGVPHPAERREDGVQLDASQCTLCVVISVLHSYSKLLVLGDTTAVMYSEPTTHTCVLEGSFSCNSCADVSLTHL